jgi:hypothetical protein
LKSIKIIAYAGKEWFGERIIIERNEINVILVRTGRQEPELVSWATNKMERKWKPTRRWQAAPKERASWGLGGQGLPTDLTRWTIQMAHGRAGGRVDLVSAK